MSDQERIAMLVQALRNIRNHCDAAISRGEASVRLAAVLPLVNKALQENAS